MPPNNVNQLSQSYKNEMGQLGFGQQDLLNPGALAPNYPYLYAQSVAVGATSGSKANVSIRTENAGLAFMVSQIQAVVLDAAFAPVSLNQVFIELLTTDRRWMNQAVPLSLIAATAENPNGPRWMRDFILPGDTLQGTLTNYSTVAVTVHLGFSGHRYQR